ncbi:uncharacterized protein ASCRUDRAFT_77156 [Ascoidea rubescens DSM 1968]|uniref:Uncharacterized protein n=1 Tax=Ascoidea rubescens DSM 1968 TaxID=1344418 RepID=A0A1D2VCQ8_9ASCO|nr:hypothetical protein ASCRUDRAFT_77156 [Ascoidea rubescens DSM 1968]ODV59415.1 hypothetical protein ASCRUDRAFT_77156 [Ascoidea rubescens DSM 1968]
MNWEIRFHLDGQLDLVLTLWFPDIVISKVEKGCYAFPFALLQTHSDQSDSWRKLYRTICSQNKVNNGNCIPQVIVYPVITIQKP